ncbi:UN93A protein, partial [Polypterus senegalus]|nr:UN93A protein [Polypterus senegalus]
MFLPPILIKNLGCKWTIVVSMFCYITYSLGNIEPRWETLIPTSIILGFGGAPLWSAKCAYLTITGNLQASKENKEGKDVITQYFGIFFLIFQSSGVWGNLMSSLIFGQNTNKGVITEEQLQFCGANDCPNNKYSTGNGTGNGTETSGVPNNLRYTLLGIYIGVGLLAVVLVSVFLENVDRAVAHQFRENRDPFWSTLMATFKQMKDKRQLLLIPITMYSGFEQGFLAGDYTKSYVTCALGIDYVGYVMICFAATNSLCSLAFGRLSQYTGRIALFVLALYGVLFEKHKEAAFSNYCLWESVGFVIAFGYSTFLCVYVKLYVVLAVLIIGMVLYGCVEYTEYKHPTPKEETLYGVLFEKHKEAAFSNYCLWESVGFVIAFGYSTFLCVYVKLYVVLAVLIIGMVLYGISCVQYGKQKVTKVSKVSLTRKTHPSTSSSQKETGLACKKSPQPKKKIASQNMENVPSNKNLCMLPAINKTTHKPASFKRFSKVECIMPRSRVGDFILTFPFNEATVKASQKLTNVKAAILEVQKLLNSIVSHKACGMKRRKEDISSNCRFVGKEQNGQLLWGPKDPPLLSVMCTNNHNDSFR